MRIGLVGLGPQARLFAEILSKLGHDIVAAYHPNPAKHNKALGAGGNIVAETAPVLLRTSHSLRDLA